MQNRLSYSIKAAAVETGLGRRTLDYLIAGGRLRAVKVGRRTLIPGVELAKLIENGCPAIPKPPARKKGETGSDRAVV